ncbi:hypothetical protein [Allosalinactinospora lopnorensis]|uniref:hypothetical protein n=1 Tax=Allosalinactinospora lopnorensis TaxID=1352348 RepID=UPI00191BEBB9|nr:hypothetical protein [Allosalinactinospora lopnorensis]
MAIVVIFTGLALLLTALGFLVAVSIRIRLDDRSKGYRSLRNDEGTGALSHSVRLLVDLHFPRQPIIPRPRGAVEDSGNETTGRDQLPA